MKLIIIGGNKFDSFHTNHELKLTPAAGMAYNEIHKLQHEKISSLPASASGLVSAIT